MEFLFKKTGSPSSAWVAQSVKLLSSAQVMIWGCEIEPHAELPDGLRILSPSPFASPDTPQPWKKEKQQKPIG